MQEINWLNEIFFSTNLWGLFGPVILVAIGIYFAERNNYVLVMIMFLVDALAIMFYSDLIDETPFYIWHIFILLIGGLLTLAFPFSKRR